VVSEEGLHVNVKSILTSTTFVLAIGIPAVVVAANNWTPWVSEEDGGPWAWCGPVDQAVSGFECNGDFCNNVRMRCETLPLGITVASYNYPAQFSEENDGIGTVSSEGWYRYDNSYSHVCNYAGAAGILNGIRCDGNFCNNISLMCATPMLNLDGGQQPAELGDCEWTDYYSEEDGPLSYEVGANRFITGVRCSGSFCNDKSFYVCSLLAPADSCLGECGGRARGDCYCDTACGVNNDCCEDYESMCVP
jgi:hypothetical protein